MISYQPSVISLLFAMLATGAAASDLDEFKVKRVGPFEFAQKPVVTRRRDTVTVRFEAKAYCDATVAVEDDEGKIIRHLASGVLGKNAPTPFQKNSLKQTLVWDGKNDQGTYIDDKDRITIRVSLGLKPQFERTLYWTPKKRHSGLPPIMRATPQGVYVYDSGSSIDHVRFFNHKGDYVRTVYPFPGNKAGAVNGLNWHAFPQDGKRLPIKCNFLQTTMLTSGTNCQPVTYRPKSKTYESVVGGFPEHFGMGGRAALGMAVRPSTGSGQGPGNGLIVLSHWTMNRLGTDGGRTSASMHGPKISYKARLRLVHSFPGGIYDIAPRSMAFSPDGKWLYLAGYHWAMPWNNDGLHGVARMRPDGDKPPEVFAGSFTQGARGSDAKHFSYPVSVACDAKGRVYVADYMNDRIQVFDASGKLLKSIRSLKPVEIRIHPRTGEIYVFSWMIGNDVLAGMGKRARELRQSGVRVPAALRVYKSFANPKEIKAWPLPLRGYNDLCRGMYTANGAQLRADIDFWTDPMTIWLVPGAPDSQRRRGPGKVGILLVQIKDGKLAVVRDFGKEVDKDRLGSHGSANIRQRLHVNPATGRLYVVNGGSFQEATMIDPVTGKHKTVPLPHNSEEMCFDHAGRAYLRSMSFVARFDAQTWREVPWDYGERQKRLSFSSHSWARFGSAVAALPVFQGINWHMGGMHVSVSGNLAVACYVSKNLELRTDEKEALQDGAKYAPRVYPGRLITTKGALIHVWDPRGKLIIEDAVPGLPDLYGVAIDKDNAIYVLSSGTRIVDGKRHFNDMAGTVIKFRPKQGRVISVGKSVPVKVKAGLRPKRPLDVQSAIGGAAWVEGADWMFGGVGYCGKNRGTGCSCYNTRFAQDYFARSFAPELDRYSVAVLDKSGNVILRMGTYGNVNDGVPLIKKGGPANPRSLGGDEVALFHGAYLATHTDQRLFIADPGNARILSVKLGYYATERVALKGVKEAR
jgi:DNA-binding beta-propeller fold protein YncE